MKPMGCVLLLQLPVRADGLPQQCLHALQRPELAPRQRIDKPGGHAAGLTRQTPGYKPDINPAAQQFQGE